MNSDKAQTKGIIGDHTVKLGLAGEEQRGLMGSHDSNQPFAISSIYARHSSSLLIKRKKNGSLNDGWAASCALSTAGPSEELIDTDEVALSISKFILMINTTYSSLEGYQVKTAISLVLTGLFFT